MKKILILTTVIYLYIAFIAQGVSNIQFVIPLQWALLYYLASEVRPKLDKDFLKNVALFSYSIAIPSWILKTLFHSGAELWSGYLSNLMFYFPAILVLAGMLVYQKRMSIKKGLIVITSMYLIVVLSVFIEQLPVHLSNSLYECMHNPNAICSYGGGDSTPPGVNLLLYPLANVLFYLSAFLLIRKNLVDTVDVQSI